MKVILEYLREHSSAWPLQSDWAEIVEILRKQRLTSSRRGIEKGIIRENLTREITALGISLRLRNEEL